MTPTEELRETLDWRIEKHAKEYGGASRARRLLAQALRNPATWESVVEQMDWLAEREQAKDA